MELSEDQLVQRVESYLSNRYRRIGWGIYDFEELGHWDIYQAYGDWARWNEKPYIDKDPYFKSPYEWRFIDVLVLALKNSRFYSKVSGCDKDDYNFEYHEDGYILKKEVFEAQRIVGEDLLERLKLHCCYKDSPLFVGS